MGDDLDQSAVGDLWGQELSSGPLGLIVAQIDSKNDLDSCSVVSRQWYEADRRVRSNITVSNAYSVSVHTISSRYTNITSITLKGFNSNVHPWLQCFVNVYPKLETLRLKRMTVNDESLELIASSLASFKVLCLTECKGFTARGLKAIARQCKLLTEFSIVNCCADVSGEWLDGFPPDLESLKVLKFACLKREVNFDKLLALVSRCKSLRVLSINNRVTFNHLRQLLMNAPQIVDLHTGSFNGQHQAQLESFTSTMNNCTDLRALSGLWCANSRTLPVLYGACVHLTALNLCGVFINNRAAANVLRHCTNLRKLWVRSQIGNVGLRAIASSCPHLQELRVFCSPKSNVGGNYPKRGLSNQVALWEVFKNCHLLHYVTYCTKHNYWTGDTLTEMASNLPLLTHIKLYVHQHSKWCPDIRRGINDILRNCPLQTLALRTEIADEALKSIGRHGKHLQKLWITNVHVHDEVHTSDIGVISVLKGCEQLRKLFLKGCNVGDNALLQGRAKYANMNYLILINCRVTVHGCEELARLTRGLVVKYKATGARRTDVAEEVYIYASFLPHIEFKAPPSITIRMRNYH